MSHLKNKFKFLVGISLKRKIKTKWFAVANILLAILIIGVSNIDNIIKFFGGDFDSKTKIYVIDETKVSYEMFSSAMNESVMLAFEEEKYEIIKSDNTKEELLEVIKTDEEKDSIILIIDTNETDILKAEVISNDYIDTLDYNLITNSLNNIKLVLAIQKYNIEEEALNALTSNATIERLILDETKDSAEENMAAIMTTVFPIIILPIFMLTIFLVQMIGAEVNDEKTTKGMEIIISNVSPKVHFFSKCLAGNLFILIQSLLLISYVAVGIFSRRLFGGSDSGNIMALIGGFLDGLFTQSFIDSLYYIIPLILVLTILTFIAYSLLAGILASVTTNTEDFQQMQTPIMMTLLVGYYLGIMAGTFKGAIFIKILGYVPFISSILSPSLLVMGDFTVIDMFISIALTIITIFLLIRYGLRIYKVGILNYSSNGLWKKMFKALKQK
ncbi:MAG: ABC transporter permease [Firmicutes bacterium]|nr:ABC transporter permease [Bacillota bacterium]